MFETLKFAKEHELALKSMKSMTTDDGLAWSTKVTIAGREIGTVANDGNGGHPNVRIASKEDFDKLVELYHSCETLRTEGVYMGKDIDDHGHPTAYDEMRIEMLISMIADEMDMLKRIKKQCKTNFLIRLQGDGKDEYRVLNLIFNEHTKQAMLARYPVEEFLNETVTTL